MPEDSLLDAAGRPTRDGAVMFQEPRGALIAMGEHKGSGLAILCELLAGRVDRWPDQPARATRRRAGSSTTCSR